ncbi:sigma 54-interacting transcriptional regulator [Nannocystis pusilla]|uniref:sigma 54-interacting transcriptional regulator n=1 Tax=Nannocystis pusilla TaxID=889268 RepID=UPI003DA3DC4C
MGLGPPDRERTVSIADAPRGLGSAGVARLVVVHPRPLVGILPLAGDEVVLGRTAGAAGSLVIGHPTVSRNHALLRWNAGAGCHTVADCGSHNGTWLEGSPVRNVPRFLADQAVLRFGDVLAVYERREQTVADAPEVSLEAVPGQSLAALALRAAVARAGGDPSPALIEGATGVGKERIAAELHRLSGRRGPLVVVNCAALSPSVIESQLFGHTRGAFTGAITEQLGLFRAAAGGTLFLDELGELPLELQPKLLRAVELGEVVAVGSTQRQQVDVRLVAATNRSLADEVARGKFRRDLHARVSLCQVAVPPLSARRSDLLPWLDRLHRAWGQARGHSELAPLELHTDAALALLLHSWPDNLRGLQRLVHGVATTTARAALTQAEVVAWFGGEPAAARVETPPVPPMRTPSNPTPRPEAPRLPARTRRPRPSAEELLAALERLGWSIRATAKHYAVERKQISRWIERYAIVPPAGRVEDDDADEP